MAYGPHVARGAFWLAVVGTVIAAPSSLPTQAGQTTPAAAVQDTFHSATDLITVDVSVLDGSRQAVEGLKASDFAILEDGKPRRVAAFTPVEVPAADRESAAGVSGVGAAAWPREATHDVVANSLPAEGRLVVILFDRSIPAGPSVQVAQKVGVKAIDELGPGDLAAVARSSGFGNDGRVQGFTSDRKLLLDALHSQFKGETAGPDMTHGSGPDPHSPVPDAPTVETTDCYCGLCVFETISNIAHAMQDAPRRRKTILFVGSAIKIQVDDNRDSCAPVLKEPRERMFRDLDMANVTVHSIDPVGLNTTSPMADFNSIHPPSVALVPARNQANQRRLDDLRVLPGRTGGRLVANTNDPDRLLPAVFAESRSYYLLGFEPASPGDGKFHRIEVKVRRGGVSVHARNGYTSAAVAESDPGTGDPVDRALIAALNGPLPRQDLPLVISVATFPRGDAHAAPVAVQLGVELPASERTRLAIKVGAFSITGRLVQEHHQVIDVPPLGGGFLSEGLLARLNLPPGSYEIRAAVREERTGKVGSVFSSIEIPVEGRSVLAMSGVLLRGATPPAMPDDPLKDLVPFVPTVNRSVLPGTTLTAFVRVQEPDQQRAVRVMARVLDTQGAIRVEREQTLEADSLHSTDGACLIELPLPRVPPGEYLLRVQASDDRATVQRDVRITVGGSSPAR